MVFCRYCGASLLADASFCSSCGKPVSPTSDADASPAQSSPTPSTVGQTLLLTANELTLNKKIVSVREHYDIQDASGTPLGQADGNFFQLPAKFAVLDSTGAQILSVNGKLVSLRREFDIYDSGGNMLAAIKKKIARLIGSEYWLELNGNQFVRIYGNFVEHDYRFQANGVDVAQVHKKWVSVRDSFNISILGPIDHRFVLGSVVVIEHEEVTERRR